MCKWRGEQQKAQIGSAWVSKTVEDVLFSRWHSAAALFLRTTLSAPELYTGAMTLAMSGACTFSRAPLTAWLRQHLIYCQFIQGTHSLQAQPPVYARAVESVATRQSSNFISCQQGFVTNNTWLFFTPVFLQANHRSNGKEFLGAFTQGRSTLPLPSPGTGLGLSHRFHLCVWPSRAGGDLSPTRHGTWTTCWSPCQRHWWYDLATSGL